MSNNLRTNFADVVNEHVKIEPFQSDHAKQTEGYAAAAAFISMSVGAIPAAPMYITGAMLKDPANPETLSVTAFSQEYTPQVADVAIWLGAASFVLVGAVTYKYLTGKMSEKLSRQAKQL